MNPVAEKALASARARQLLPVAVTAAPVPAAVPETQPPAPALPAAVPAAEHFSRVLYLEGRRHAREIIRDSQAMLQSAAWARELAETLRRAAAGRPASFAKGVLEIAALVERAAQALEVSHG